MLSHRNKLQQKGTFLDPRNTVGLKVQISPRKQVHKVGQGLEYRSSPGISLSQKL